MTQIVQFFCWHRKFLIYNLVIRNLKVRYRKSFLGFLWTLIVPIAMTLVYLFVFKYIAKIGDANYPILLLSGIIPWTFFATTLASGTDSLVNNFSILTKVPITNVAFPLAEACSAFINLLLSFPVLLVFGTFYGIFPTFSWICLPLIFIMLFLQTYCMSLLLAISNVYLRDVRHMVGILVQIWMYMTPILYSADLIPADILHWFYLNPLFSIFDSIHVIFLNGEWPQKWAYLHMMGWTLALWLMAFMVNEKLKSKLVEKL